MRAVRTSTTMDNALYLTTGDNLEELRADAHAKDDDGQTPLLLIAFKDFGADAVFRRRR